MSFHHLLCFSIPPAKTRLDSIHAFFFLLFSRPTILYLVGVEGVDDQAHQLRDFSLEGEGFSFARHDVFRIKRRGWRKERKRKKWQRNMVYKKIGKKFQTPVLRKRHTLASSTFFTNSEAAWTCQNVLPLWFFFVLKSRSIPLIVSFSEKQQGGQEKVWSITFSHHSWR